MLQDGPDNRKRRLISEEAAEWFARMQVRRVSLDERQRFLRWLKQSPVHVAEYLAIANIRGELQRALKLTAVVTEEATDVAVSRWKIAAAIAVLGIAVLLFFVARPAWQERPIATEPGQWTTRMLADGSEVQVGPNTMLQIDLGDARRSIVLARGEAYFKVAKDPARPFFVEANAFAVRATGTEFAVARRKRELIVTVAEGSVRVAPSSRSEHDVLSVPIAANQQLRIGDTWPATPRQVDVRYELAWRERQLMFRPGDTLAFAVEEFNLRNRIQLQLDPRAAALPVRGSFDAADPVAFARTMDGTAPVAIEQLAPELWRIQPE